MVFLFFFLKRPCSLTFHHSYRGRHPRLFSYGNTYLLYIYISIFCKSHKVQKPSWSGERIFAKGFRFLLTLPCGSGLFPLLLGFGWKKEKKKKMLLQKIKWKGELSSSLSGSLSFLAPALSSRLTGCWTSDALSAEFSLLESLGNFRHLYIGICGLGALQLAPQKSNPHPNIWLPAREAPEMLLSSGKIHVNPAGHPNQLWGPWGLVVPWSIRRPDYLEAPASWD